MVGGQRTLWGTFGTHVTLGPSSPSSPLAPYPPPHLWPHIPLLTFGPSSPSSPLAPHPPSSPLAPYPPPHLWTLIPSSPLDPHPLLTFGPISPSSPLDPHPPSPLWTHILHCYGSQLHTYVIIEHESCDNSVKQYNNPHCAELQIPCTIKPSHAKRA